MNGRAGRDDRDALKQDVFGLDITAERRRKPKIKLNSISLSITHFRKHWQMQEDAPVNHTSLLVQVSNAVSDLEDDVPAELFAKVRELDNLVEELSSLHDCPREKDRAGRRQLPRLPARIHPDFVDRGTTCGRGTAKGVGGKGDARSRTRK